LFGTPDRVASMNVNAPSVRYHMFSTVYQDHAFEIQTMTRCPINSPRTMWYSTVYMVLPITGLIRGGRAETAGSC
jgi:hypothetical protein